VFPDAGQRQTLTSVRGSVMRSRLKRHHLERSVGIQVCQAWADEVDGGKRSL
jgi:hypothetical protein